MSALEVIQQIKALPPEERKTVARYVLKEDDSWIPDEFKEAARRALRIFKENPFDPRLGAHRIHRLCAHYGRTIYAVEVEGDLRSTFYLEGDTVVSLIIGTHDVYKE
jgi:hypothetical protein